MSFESDNAIDRVWDSINEWGDGLRLIQWIKAIDARVGQWSIDRQWQGRAQQVQKLLDSYPPASSARNTIRTYFAARHNLQYVPWKDQTDLDKVRHFLIAEKTIAGGNPDEVEALLALKEVIG